MKQRLPFLILGFFVATMIASCRKSPMDLSAVNPSSVSGIDVKLTDPIENTPAVLRPVPGRISPDILGYYEALPAHYYQTTKKYPVIFFFPGGGQYGDGHSDLDTVLADGIGKLLGDKKFPPSFTVSSGTYSFIVILPQLVRKLGNNQIDSLVNFAVKKYRIDPSRIYFSGFSVGARAVCNYAAYKPTPIAAIVTMAGMPEMNSLLTTKCAAMGAARLPVWHFHAKNDSAWKYTESVKFINTLKTYALVVPPRFTLFAKGIRRLNHDCWTQASDPAYKENGKNIYEWMLGYKR